MTKVPHSNQTKRLGRNGTKGLALAALLLSSLIALAGLANAPSASAIFPGENGRIVFESDRDGNSEIYVMNADGSNQIRLTNHLGEDTYPKWSPDGTKIAFTRDHQIHVMNADGSGQTNLSNSSSFSDRYPSWSPDGTKILFDRNVDGLNQIHVMNADGSGQTRLIDESEGLAFSELASWSPDGTKIAFRGPPSNTYPFSQIFTVNADGSEPTRMTFTGEDLPFIMPDHVYIDWSPDGTKLTFTASPDGPNIFTVNIDGTDLQNLTIVEGGFSLWDFHSSWSPDGTKLVFTNGNGPHDAFNFDHEIHIMNADGTGQTRLTFNNDRDGNPHWGVSPNVIVPTESELTVNAVDLSGNPISGMWTVIRLASDGTVLQSGFTPLQFSGDTGTEYRVSVANYNGIVFSKWQDDESTDRSRTINLSSDTVLTAIYDTGAVLKGFTSLTYPGTTESHSLTVNAVNLDGSNTLHMWTVIDSQTIAESGTTYKVHIHNYQDIIFDHWEDDNTDMVRTLTITEDTTITAYYQTG